MTALADLPPEMLDYITRCASDDAERVVSYLANAGIHPADADSNGVPAGVMLDLGAICRMRVWESADIFFHVEAGLPDAQSALTNVIKRLEQAAVKDRLAAVSESHFAGPMLTLSLRHFAWLGPACLETEVRIAEGDDEEALLDALAQCLWSQRHKINIRSTP